MPWQKVTRHISDSRVVVESKSGNTYPARPEYDHLGSGIYSYMINDAHEDMTVWGWIDFDGDEPLLEDWVPKSDDEPPDSPPWER